MKTRITRVLSYFMVFAMVLGVVNIGGINTVSAAVDTQADMERFILVMESTDIQDREDVVKLIATLDTNGIYVFNSGIDPNTVKVDIAIILNKNIADPVKQISQTTIVNAINYMNSNYGTYGTYINTILTTMSKPLQPLADSTKENTGNGIVDKVTKKFYSYNLFLNFLVGIKGKIGNVALFYSSNDKIEQSVGLTVAIALTEGLQDGSQGNRYTTYKALFEEYMADVNNWDELDERRAFISDLTELGLCESKPSTPDGGGGSTPSTTIPDGTVNTKTNADGTKESTVTISDQAVNNDIANTQLENVTLDLTPVKDAVKVSAELTGAMIDKIADSSKGIEIKSGNAVLLIPEEVIKQLSQASNNEKVTIVVSETKSEPASNGMNIVGKTLDFSMNIGNKKITEFDSKIKGQMHVDMSQVRDYRKVIASYYNEVSKQWEPINGYLNKTTGELVFYTDHFSKFAAVEYSKKFSDVTTAWAIDNIEVLASRNIMNGKASDKFDPKANITRAEVAAIIARALNLDTKPATGKFTDVASGKWYAAEVEAAANAGIVGGIGNGKFAPEAQITREQIAAMICRALEYKQGKITTIPAVTFTDAAKISSYAKDSVAIAASKNIVKGSNNMFKPADKATREQVAVMVYRLLEVLGEM